MVRVNQFKTNWVYALGTPSWAYGVAPGIPPKSSFCIIFYDMLEEAKWYIAGEHERDQSAASTKQPKKPKYSHSLQRGTMNRVATTISLAM